jgi:hypothetical protein
MKKLLIVFIIFLYGCTPDEPFIKNDYSKLKDKEIYCYQPIK